jgi:1,4-dihydroxy-2-naphthoate octaprenyltransferase
VAILVVNNLRDIETDGKTGKRTLAVVVGRQATRIQYVALAALAYASSILFLATGWASWWVLLPWLTLPMAIQLVWTIFRAEDGPALNRALASTANLDLVFSVLFAVGLVL